MSLRQGCNVILQKDCVSLAEKLHAGHRGGRKVIASTKCASCSAYVIPAENDGLIVFFCSHVYHQRCLRSAQDLQANNLRELWCIICQSQNKQQRKPPLNNNKATR